MTVEYSSLLLARLSSELEEDQMVDLLSDIEELNDPIFVYPLYQAYKNNKISYISHYFLSAISCIDSKEIIQIGLEVGENPSTTLGDLYYVFQIFEKMNTYNARTISIATLALSKFIIEKCDDEYDLYRILSYLEDSNKLAIVELELFHIFSSDPFNLASREYSFNKWLEINPVYNLQVVIHSFERLKNDSTKEKVIARIIRKWTGPKSEELKSIIEYSGSTEAAAIIKIARKKQLESSKQKRETQNKVIQEKYSGADLVQVITQIREKVNIEAEMHKEIGFLVFPPNENMFTQLSIARDEASLMKACVNLREVIQDINPKFNGHGLENSEIETLIPDVSSGDAKKSINQLFLFFSAKKLSIDKGVFGLKKLNKIVGLLGAHPKKERKKLLKILEKLDLCSLYLEENWEDLHRQLLNQYIGSLKKILSSIKSKERR